MANFIAMLVLALCLIGPWLLRSARQAGLLLVLSVVTMIVALFIPFRWVSAAEDCPDHLPPTGHVSCGDNAEGVLLFAIIVFVSVVARLAIKDLVLGTLRWLGAPRN